MNNDDRLLLRHLHGELPTEEAQALERRLAREPELARRQTELAGLWHSLEGPPMPRHDPDLTHRVVSAAQQQAELVLPAPRWARTGAVAALLLGAWLGFLVGPLVGTGVHPGASPGPVIADTLDFTHPPQDLFAFETDDQTLDDLALEGLTLEEAFATAPSLAESFWFESDTAASPETAASETTEPQGQP